MDLQEYIHIGLVGKAQGIKGEVKFVIYSGMPDELSDCEDIVLQDDKGQCRNFALEKLRWQGKFLVAKLEGVNNRDESEALSGRAIWLHGSQRPALPGKECYWFEYEGLNVVTETGRDLGVVQGVFATGAHDVLVVSGQGHEYLIPMIEDVLVEIDRDAGKIVISPMPGLLDINS